VIVGHSFGGTVALAMGQRRPGAARGLVLMAPASSPRIPSLGLVAFAPVMRVSDAWAAALSMMASDTMIQAFLMRIFTPDPVPDGYVAHFGPRLALVQEKQAHRIRQIAVLRDSLRRLSVGVPALATPSLVLHGTHDRVLRFAHHGAALAAALPRGHLHALPGTGHMPHHVRTAEVVQAIAGFALSL
jgi:Predicted hydrolases or acyltransferases (alpha/beta hydrolase superfamily)